MMHTLHPHTDRQTDTQTDGCTDKHTDRQTDGQTDTQTEGSRNYLHRIVVVMLKAVKLLRRHWTVSDTCMDLAGT